MPELSDKGIGRGKWTPGAEHVVPRFIDACFESLRYLKKEFSLQDLSALVLLCKDVPDDFVPSSHARYLASLVRGSHAGEELAGVNLSRLEKRLAQMQERDAGVLFLWARAFWKSPAAGRENIARYAGAD